MESERRYSASSASSGDRDAARSHYLIYSTPHASPFLTSWVFIAGNELIASACQPLFEGSYRYFLRFAELREDLNSSSTIVDDSSYIITLAGTSFPSLAGTFFPLKSSENGP